MLLFLFCDIPTLYHSQLTAVKMRFLLSSISGCNVGSGSQAIHHFRNEKEAGAVTWDREKKLVNIARPQGWFSLATESESESES